MKFRFHVINLPHTQTTAQYNACAYTQKVVKFCRMMKSLGHEVYLYQAYFEQLYTLWNDNGRYSDWNAGISKYKRYSKFYPN